MDQVIEEDYSNEEIGEGWGACSYCGELEDDCLCSTDDTERFYR